MAQYVRPETPSASWMHPDTLNTENYAMGRGKIFLGRTKDGRDIGVDDNRHIVTIAGSRAGKSATSLMSNLLLWEGSTIIIDPKGELATNTAKHRMEMGQTVCILDPFHEVKSDDLQSLRMTYNPLDALRGIHPDDVVDEASSLADSIITSEGGKIDHWTLSAKNLIRGFILFALHKNPETASLNDVREYLNLPYETEGDDEPDTMEDHFQEMRDSPDAFDGVLAGIGGSMMGKPDNERGSIISTAIEQTAFLDSKRLKDHIAMTGLPSMRVLKEKPATIYLVLPASRMGTHFRWLRALLTQAMTALEQEKNDTGFPVLFILEEFPTLGFMRLIEASAGLMAGYGVKLWTVLQDLSQLKAHYPKSWETFLGNAGIIEAFGNTDMTTLEYLSKRMGQSLSYQIQKNETAINQQQQGQTGVRETIVNVPLMAPYEISQTFARDKQNKLILSDQKPFGIGRVYWRNL